MYIVCQCLHYIVDWKCCNSIITLTTKYNKLLLKNIWLLLNFCGTFPISLHRLVLHNINNNYINAIGLWSSVHLLLQLIFLYILTVPDLISIILNTWFFQKCCFYLQKLFILLLSIFNISLHVYWHVITSFSLFFLRKKYN